MSAYNFLQFVVLKFEALAVLRILVHLLATATATAFGLAFCPSSISSLSGQGDAPSLERLL